MSQQGAPRRIGIISQGTSEFDSRAHRIARSLAARGDTVTLYSRVGPGLPATETLDGYRIVRLPLAPGEARAAAGTKATDGTRARGSLPRRALDRGVGLGRKAWRRAWALIERQLARTQVWQRFDRFPRTPMTWASWYERQVEPHDLWHGMWAGSLPALDRIRARRGGATLYDPRDVFLRSREYDAMSRPERAVLTWYERHWAQRMDAVIQVSEPYAEMTARDLHLRDVPVVRNCPDRWDPPVPRPDRFRELLGIPAGTRIVLYQGLLIRDRGIEQAMDAVLEVPDTVLVIMGFDDHRGGSKRRGRYRELAAAEPYLGRVHVIDAVPPEELLTWSASADVMVMLYQPNTENHRYVTPQKLWEAMAAGVPVVASDLPGMAAIVRETGCGELCDPTSPASVADAIRRVLGDDPAHAREMGERGHAAAQERYNWDIQFEVLESVYKRLLGPRP